jgi:hypothetical protein
MRVSAQRHLKLMPENKVLEREIPTRPSSENGGKEKEEQDFEHVRIATLSAPAPSNWTDFCRRSARQDWNPCRAKPGETSEYCPSQLDSSGCLVPPYPRSPWTPTGSHGLLLVRPRCR